MLHKLSHFALVGEERSSDFDADTGNLVVLKLLKFHLRLT